MSKNIQELAADAAKEIPDSVKVSIEVVPAKDGQAPLIGISGSSNPLNVTLLTSPNLDAKKQSMISSTNDFGDSARTIDIDGNGPDIRLALPADANTRIEQAAKGTPDIVKNKVVIEGCKIAASFIDDSQFRGGSNPTALNDPHFSIFSSAGIKLEANGESAPQAPALSLSIPSNVSLEIKDSCRAK